MLGMLDRYMKNINKTRLPNFTTHTHTHTHKLKKDKDLNVSHKTIKILKENIGI